jgi:hypothetical protein
MQPLKLPSLLHGTPYFKTFNTIESPLWSFPFLLFPIQENVFFKFHLTEYILAIRGFLLVAVLTSCCARRRRFSECSAYSVVFIRSLA